MCEFLLSIRIKDFDFDAVKCGRCIVGSLLHSVAFPFHASAMNMTETMTLCNFVVVRLVIPSYFSQTEDGRMIKI